MKHDNINYVLVGSFVLIVILGFFIVLGMITGRSGPADNYYVIYQNVTGIKYGTLVSYEGYHVGQVEDVVPIHDGGKTRYKVVISVGRNSNDKQWNIPSDSVARVVADGLLSVFSIDIKEGTATTFYKPGDEIRGAGAKDVFGAFAELATQLNELTQSGVKPLVDSVSKSLSTVSAAAEGAIPKILAELASLSEHLNQSAKQVDLLLSQDNRERMESLLRRLNSSLDGLDGLVKKSTSIVDDNKIRIEQSLQALRQSAQVVSQHISEITANLESASRNMTEFSRQLRQNPGLLIGGEAPKDKVRERQ